ncbi:FtsB family cell division protein [Paenarthrobacter sp. JL.01a]|uniref:FtsB family cell division protein n=1 Tax=Paenarthrobacter sp. JL.01a TaxID=2979324 RepID=UPI0021C623AF|nr:septum formation initiator family protein [Paenarthrobacter sp. JL.01a]UXM92945.1 septum formation initiator family protein [Paenarthrobacter sp. JL.01a]
MATRRPKVPRADALGRPAGAARPAGASASGRPAAQASDDADVITLGAARTTDKSSTTTKSSTTATGTKAPAAKSAPASAKPKSGSKGNAQKRTGKAPSKDRADRGSEHLDPVPAKAFSGRMLALAVVMIAITVLLAPTVKIFLEKRSEISALEAEIASRKAEQTELNKQISRWQDPNYVKQQARDRINMVMPGETGYWVFGGEDAAGTPGGRTGSGSTANPENLPWVDALWESIRRSATD